MQIFFRLLFTFTMKYPIVVTAFVAALQGTAITNTKNDDMSAYVANNLNPALTEALGSVAPVSVTLLL